MTKRERTERSLASVEREARSLRKQLELSEERVSKLHSQLRAALEAKVLTSRLDPSDLWTAATMAKSGDVTAHTFSQLASRWALGLPLDIDTLREATGPLSTGVERRERRVGRLRDAGRKELAGYMLPLIESLWDEANRILESTEEPGDPVEALGRVYDRIKNFPLAIGTLQDMLLSELESTD